MISYPIAPSDISGVAELNAYLFAEVLGEGEHRVVYAMQGNTEHVLKVTKEGRNWANFAEKELWDVAQNTPLAKFLAPCVSMSDGGRILCQRRVERLILPCEAPEYLPACLSGTHHGNLGILAGQVIMFDYGLNLARFNGIDPMKRSKTRAWVSAHDRLKRLRKEQKNPKLKMKDITWG